MKHFVIYHNADRQGDVPWPDGSNSFGIVTNSSVREARGARIWLVMGKGAPKTYGLCYSFTGESILSGEAQGYKHRVVGTFGTRFDPPIRLNSLPWFADFRKSQGNFAFGLSPIRQQEFVDGLLALAPPIAIGDGKIVAASRAATLISRIIRDTALAAEVKSIHDGICQLCSSSLILPNGQRYSEGHHIKPLGSPHNGPDVSSNILCVCPTCHVKLDYGVVRLNHLALPRVANHEPSPEFVNYHNEKIYAGERIL